MWEVARASRVNYATYTPCAARPISSASLSSSTNLPHRVPLTRAPHVELSSTQQLPRARNLARASQYYLFTHHRIATGGAGRQHAENNREEPVARDVGTRRHGVSVSCGRVGVPTPRSSAGSPELWGGDPSSRRATRSFSEALCFGDPGVGYELHLRAEEVGPEAPARTQGRRSRKGSSPDRFGFVVFS